MSSIALHQMSGCSAWFLLLKDVMYEQAYSSRIVIQACETQAQAWQQKHSCTFAEKPLQTRRHVTFSHLKMLTSSDERKHCCSGLRSRCCSPALVQCYSRRGITRWSDAARTAATSQHRLTEHQSSEVPSLPSGGGFHESYADCLCRAATREAGPSRAGAGNAGPHHVTYAPALCANFPGMMRYSGRWMKYKQCFVVEYTDITL